MRSTPKIPTKIPTPSRHFLTVFACVAWLFALATPAAQGAGSSGAATDAIVTSPSSLVDASTCNSLAGTTPPTVYPHVIWIWFENKSYSDIIGNTAYAPYLNALADNCGLATNYYGITHQSLPNYLAATGGVVRQGYSATALSVFGQVSWRAYMESMPTNCDQTSEGTYLKDHNPPLYYAALAAACPTKDVPMGDTTSGRFLTALNNNTLRAFSFISPNGCNDMHGCGGETKDQKIADGDRWLQQWVPLITNTPEYQNGSVMVFVSFDEGEPTTQTGEVCLSTLSESCHVATFVITPYVGHRVVGTLYSHYSLLKTTEEMLGRGFLNHASDPSTTSMRTGFGI